MTSHSKQSLPPSALHEHAQDNLRFIRAAMERSTAFTGVSGLGYGLAGGSAIGAAYIATRQETELSWLLIWMLELCVAALVAFGLTVRKAARQGSSLFSTSGTKLLMAFIPTMSAGGVITLAFFLNDRIALLPGIWLSLYGAAVMTAGAWSVRIIPVMGALFLSLGTLTMLAPVNADLMLAVGFGGFHIVFGIIIGRKYGG